MGVLTSYSGVTLNFGEDLMKEVENRAICDLMVNEAVNRQNISDNPELLEIFMLGVYHTCAVLTEVFREYGFFKEAE